MLSEASRNKGLLTLGPFTVHTEEAESRGRQGTPAVETCEGLILLSPGRTQGLSPVRRHREPTAPDSGTQWAPSECRGHTQGGGEAVLGTRGRSPLLPGEARLYPGGPFLVADCTAPANCATPGRATCWRTAEPRRGGARHLGASTRPPESQCKIEPSLLLKPRSAGSL